MATRRFCAIRDGRLAALIALVAVVALPAAAASADIPSGVWLLETKAAVRIFDCAGRLCGQIVWLQRSRNSAGQLVIDKKNPDPVLRARPICGLNVLWGLKPDGPDRWKDGWLYNPDDGITYRVRGELRSADTFGARIYAGLPLFGKTSIWTRVPRLDSEGWC
jgi:uncharacterized protein (DUF2147 family)